MNINFISYVNNNSTVDTLCQEKLYDKKPHIMTDVIIPIKSAISAAASTNRIFFIPTHAVYIAMV